MRATVQGSPSFSHVHVDIEPGESFYAESGAMQSMSAELDMKAISNGGFFSALGKKFFGGESFFINRFTNNGDRTMRVTIAQDVPGEIVELQLTDGQELALQKGAYLAHFGDVRLKTTWAGFASWVGGEGLLRLTAKASGRGTLYFGAYGAVIKKTLTRELKVDDGHLVAYTPSLHLKVAMAGGIFASLFGGEGLVTRVSGTGDVYLQSRSIRGLAAWLNPKFR